jgi:hypothetical protein
MDKKSKKIVADLIKEFQMAVASFFGNLDEITKTSLDKKVKSEPAKHKLSIKYLGKKRKELDRLYSFFIACQQPKLANKILNDTIIDSFMGYIPPPSLTPDNISKFLNEFIAFTSIKVKKQKFFIDQFNLPQDLFISVSVFKRRLEKLLYEENFSNKREGFKDLVSTINDTQKMHTKKLFEIKQKNNEGTQTADDYFIYHYSFALAELCSFFSDAIIIIDAYLDLEKESIARSNLASRILLVSCAFHNNKSNFFHVVKNSDLSFIDENISKMLMMSCLSLEQSNLNDTMKELEHISFRVPYISYPKHYELLFEGLIKSLTPTIDSCMRFISHLRDNHEKVDFADLVKITGWVSALLILKHDIEALLQNRQVLQIEEILEPIQFLFDLDEESSSEEDSLSEIETDEGLPQEASELLLTPSHQSNQSLASIDSRALNEAEDAQEVPLEEMHDLTPLVLAHKGQVSPEDLLKRSEAKRLQKEKRKEHIQLSLARKTKGRKFLQAISELCGVEIKFANRKANGSHKTAEVASGGGSMLFTFAAHNGAKQLKIGTSSGILSAVKAFSAQLKKS